MHFDLETVRRVLEPDFGMGWNAVLALVPLALAILLFPPRWRRGVLWWLGVVVFCLFLPNSAYTLTDVLHLVHRIRREPYIPVWSVALVLIPQYAVFMLAGWQAHVLSIMRATDYLRALGRTRLVIPSELTLNLLVALGIYLGRFQRFNSWDVVGRPEKLAFTTIDDFTRRYPWELILATFGVLCVLYYATKIIDRALIEYGQQRF
ncbi:MAG TPA: DUF1361 domain-containing protein [Pirellulales bacterium]|nr:DUF1361 domain-containing protein [Pirellulales bacterium]